MRKLSLFFALLFTLSLSLSAGTSFANSDFFEEVRIRSCDEKNGDLKYMLEDLESRLEESIRKRFQGELKFISLVTAVQFALIDIEARVSPDNVEVLEVIRELEKKIPGEYQTSAEFQEMVLDTGFLPN